MSYRAAWGAYLAAAALRYAPLRVPTPYVVESCKTAPCETATPPIGMESLSEKEVGEGDVWGALEPQLRDHKTTRPPLSRGSASGWR